MKKYEIIALLIVVLTLSYMLVSGPYGNAGATTTVDAPLATLNNHPITEDEVLTKANKRMMKILSEMYSIKKQAIEEIIDDRLLAQEAKKKGVTVDALIKQATKDITAPTDEEAKTIYEMQKTRSFQGKSFEDVSASIKVQLTNQKRSTAMNDFLDKLRQGASVKINLERPSVEVSVDDDPSQGDPKAPITIIEFSEFQCPFCKRTRPTLAKIMETYKGKIRYVFRDFPLSFHKEARGAATAANCANEQGKYWEFNAKLFETQSSLSAENSKKIAAELGLNLDAFNKCVASNKYDKEIDKDQQDGMEVGVTGTPAYFVNGKFLSGAQPFTAFKEIIDEELAKVEKK